MLIFEYLTYLIIIRILNNKIQWKNRDDLHHKFDNYNEEVTLMIIIIINIKLIYEIEIIITITLIISA